MLNVELPLRTLDLRWFYQAVRKTSYDGQTFPAELLTVELPVTTSVLRWFYREVRKMLREMKYGETLPVELGNELSKILMRDLRTELVIERNLSWPDTGEELEKFKIELEKLVQDEIAAEIEIVERRQRGEFAEYAPQDLPGYKRDPDPLQERLRQIYDRSMQEDWAARWKSAGQRIPAKPQLRRFARLKHGEGIETLRASQSGVVATGTKIPAIAQRIPEDFRAHYSQCTEIT